MKRLLFCALLVAAVCVLAGSAAAAGSSARASVVYNSIPPNGPPTNIPSVGPEAYAFDEFGNEITLAGTARTLTSVTVALSSWACVHGHWYSGDCSTPSGATFSQPITLNIYDPSDPTTPIASSTQTFAVPYRPSASSKCGDGRWYQPSSKTCFNGIADNVTFSLSGVHLPDQVVYGIVYDTTHFGPNPLGEATACHTSDGGCPYDSLNIALVDETTDISAGSDTNLGTIWQNSPYGSQYCDRGLAGMGTFREDSPTCPDNYAPFVPAVQFKAGNGS